MARTAQCPSCGASVPFRSAASILAVCEYCQTTLLNLEGKVENLGKMAALVEDRSPLQLGAEGRHQGVHFAVVGRIQLQYGQGRWNEWHLLFDDQRTGWLSEAAGEYVLSFLEWVPDPVPPFASLKPGDELVLGNTAWTVTNLEQAECVAGEGELPFKVGPGYPAPVVDLRAGKRLATIDYSEGDAFPPLVFFGEVVDFASLAWNNLREGMPIPDRPTLQARALRCVSCGASLEVRHEGVLAVGCRQCGAVTDPETEKLISRLQAGSTLNQPRIPLGSIGTFRGEPLEVMGYMQRFMTADGRRYAWREYLLARVGKPGYRWLTEYDGHWNVADVLDDIPPVLRQKGRIISESSFPYREHRFEHFQRYQAEVEYVIGEFTWRVQVGEVAQLDDYVAPPYLLTRETTDKELSWSLSEYVPPEEIEQAFKLKSLPKPRGVYANQPSPVRERHRQVCRNFWIFFLLAVLLQLGLWAMEQEDVYVRESLTLQQQAEEPLLSKPFVIRETLPTLVVENRADISNDWVALHLALVNESTGEVRHGSQELSYYWGTDSGESWSEGAPEGEMVFREVPPGTWRLMLEHEMDERRDRPIQDVLTIRRGGSSWSNIILLFLFLAAFPLFTRWRVFAFEVERWAESDHPKASGGDDDD
ncbi:DUF4178 domain-containing protein [Azovibrio restrictus]|uniref:DUF4178 domain-containing protein n=1 Tax=Azovibrio restrictus TaxID=146938 RepID=UPI0026E93BCB|nr:DUF4178 domain-containing protein [Azovibrio restrictus]